ncbi:MAG: tetratricopeptide repeat protein [Planctomycetes bacterium]|nr:tetratricopeptide repeat protein [Planctomycetota bacterium]
MTGRPSLLPFLAALGASLGPGGVPDPPAGDAAAQVRWALERIGDPADPRAREAGARLLLGVEETASVPALHAATGSPSWRVRVRALELLATLGRGVPPERLREGLRSENRAVRAAALRAVAPPFGPDLASDVARLLEDPLHDVRTEALRAALRLRSRDGPDLAAAVRVRALDPDPAVRLEARRILLAWPVEPPEIEGVLGVADGEGVQEALRALLEAEEPPPWLAPRCASLAREDRMGEGTRRAAAACALLAGDRSEGSVARTISGALLAEETWLADGCSRALRRLGERAGEPLSRAMSGPGVDLPRFRTALSILADADPGEARGRLSLLEALRGDAERESAPLRAEVYRSLLDQTIRSERLRALAAEEVGEARSAAVEAVARTEGGAALPFLLERLGDSAPEVRRVAGLAAARLGGEPVSDPLAEALTLESSLENLCAFSRDFPRSVRTPAIRDALAWLLGHENERVRSAACEGLAGFARDSLALAALVRAYEGEEGREREDGPTARGVLRARRASIVEAIASVGGEGARRFLVRLVERLGPEEEEQDVASRALARLAQGGVERAWLRGLLDSEASPRVKVEAALALAPLGEEAACVLLEEEFRGFDLSLQGQALEALRKRGAASPAWFLLDVARDSRADPEVREQAMKALAPLAGREEILSFLLETLRGEGDHAARLAAVKALGLAPRPEALRAFALEPGSLPGSEEERRDLLREIAFALAPLGDPASAGVLVRVLLDEPLRRWRDSLRGGAPGPAFRPQYDVEEECLAALLRLGEAGTAALRGRIEEGIRDGRILLADPAFVLFAGERLRPLVPDLARRLLRVASRTSPGERGARLEALLAYAQVSESDGVFEEAALAYEQALAAIRERRVDPREVRSILGEEEPEGSERPLRALRVRAALSRGAAAFAAGRAIEGARAFDEALVAAGSDPRSLVRVAMRFSERPGLETRAVELAASAVERAPLEREAREAHGWCLLRAGDPRGAKGCFEASLALPDPGARGDSPARFGLAACLVALGEEEEGAALLARALEESPDLRAEAERNPVFERLRTSGRFPRPGR